MTTPFAETWFNRRILPAALVAIVVVILFAGLFTRDYAFRNEVEWNGEGGGLVFGNYGIAFTEPVLPVDRLTSERGLTIELAILPPAASESQFGFLADFSAGDAATQLVVAQWQKWIVVMNGDDYDHRRRVPRGTIELVVPPEGPTHLAFVSNSQGTSLFVDGELRQHRADLLLKVPRGDAGTRLVVGNSPDGQHPWTGGVLGLAVYGTALDSGAVRSRFEAWRSAGRVTAPDGEQPVLLYRFDDREGRSAADRSASGLDLSFPLRSSAIERPVLQWSPPFSAHRPSLAGDMLLNLAGFVPFGVVLALLLSRWLKRRHALIATTLAGALLSLGIEVVQAWIPTRSSSLLDLILNGAGAALGAALALRWDARSATRSAPDRRVGR